MLKQDLYFLQRTLQTKADGQKGNQRKTSKREHPKHREIKSLRFLCTLNTNPCRFIDNVICWRITERKIQNKFVFVGRHQREDTTGMKDGADMEREWLNFRFSTALHTRTHNLTVFLSLVAVSERWLKTFHSLVSAHIASSSAASSLPTNQLVQSHTQINTQTHPVPI